MAEPSRPDVKDGTDVVFVLNNYGLIDQSENKTNEPFDEATRDGASNFSDHEPISDHLKDSEAAIACEEAGEDDKKYNKSDQDSEKECSKSKKSNETVGIFEIFKFADRADIIMMIVGAICAAGAGGGVPAFSFALGKLVDDLLTADPEKSAAESALIMVYIGIGVTVCSMVHVSLWCIAAMRQITRVKCSYFSCVLRQDMGWHDAHKPGELTAHMTGDTRVMQNGINDKFSQGVVNLCMGIFGFIFGFVFCWELTLMMLGITPFLALFAVVFGNQVTKQTGETRKQYATAGSIATEVLENIRTVQTFGREGYEVERFKKAIRLSEKSGMKRELFNSLSVGSTMGLVVLTYMLVFFFGSYLLKWRRATIGEIVATFLCVLMACMGLGFFFPSLTAFSEARSAAYHLFKTIKRVPEIDIDDVEKKKVIHTFSDSIEFRDVSFSYPTRPDQELFKRLNLTIKKGQKVAFSGTSGCGKSSIIGLLQRFYDPKRGEVLVDGTNMKELDLFSWRDQIGIVSQEPSLFAGTMLENVRIGKVNATEEEVIAACKQANIHDTIMTLPQQYNTPVGSVGSQLSGGQKQRIAIARALVKKPAILLLDEATSALDRKSEVEVQAALDRLMQENLITIIVIAHRLATIRKVDKIYYISNDGLKGSVIAEEGSFDELISKKGLFAMMAQSQGVVFTDQTAPANDLKSEDNGGEISGTVKEEALSVKQQDDVFNRVLNEENIEKLDQGAPRTERQKVPIEKLAAWEESRVKVGPWRLLRLNKRYAWALLVALLGSLIAGAIAPVNTILLGKLLMSAATYDMERAFSESIAWDNLLHDMKLYAPMFAIIAVACFIGWLLQFFYGFAGERLTTKVRGMLMRQILRQDMSFFDIPGRDAGTLSGMLSGDCESIHQLCGQSVGLKIQTAATIVIGVIIGFCYQWKLAFIATACLPLIVFAVFFQQLLMTGLNSSKEGASDDTLVTEALSNVRTVTSFNLKRNRCDALNNLLEKEQKKRIRRNVMVGVIFGLSQFVFYGSFALCYWYGGKLIGKGEADFEDVNVASLAVLMGAMSAGEAGGFAAKIGDAKKGSIRVFSVIDRVPDVDILDPKRTAVLELSNTSDFTTGIPKGLKGPGLGIDIEFKQTHFIYPARPTQLVLAGVDLRFPPATSNGLMGETGCGKSTIIQLLACFYALRKGEITLNGSCDISQLDISRWRQHISIVLQEPDLFSGTVRDNIAYSINWEKGKNTSSLSLINSENESPRGHQKEISEDEENELHPSYSVGDEGAPTQQEIEQAAKWAGIHDDIMKMSEGYDTNVGYKGRALSGGQKQRVAIARGLLRRSTQLLLLDEATSALDNSTEAKVQEGIEEYLKYYKNKGKFITVVSIAHRLTTIRRCDQIVLLDSGRIKERGNHEALIKLGGEYKTRWDLYASGMNTH